MTTFQYIIDAILNALTHIIPLATSIPRDLGSYVLQWGEPSIELQLLIAMVGSIVFLIFFRYDWLGLFSALIKSIVQPKTLKSDVRVLDQQTLLFLLTVCIPAFLAQRVFQPFLLEHDWANHPFTYAGAFLAVAGMLQFSANWNKRINGLNHLRLMDGVTIAALACFSIHPAISLVATLWIGFALANYHYEAIFKHSMLILGVQIIAYFFSLLGHSSIAHAFETVGYLNAISALVLVFTTFWVTLEQLQKNLGEHTLKAFKWISLLSAIFYIALYFFKP